MAPFQIDRPNQKWSRGSIWFDFSNQAQKDPDLSDSRPLYSACGEKNL